MTDYSFDWLKENKFSVHLGPVAFSILISCNICGCTIHDAKLHRSKCND